MIKVDRSLDVPAYRQVYNCIRADIESGELSSGTKLPALRTLAGELGVARNTIEAAYGQLVLEGYLRSQRGSGFVVEELDFAFMEDAGSFAQEQDGPPRMSSAAAQARNGTEFDRDSTCTYNFSYGNYSPSIFPMDQWRLCADAVLKGAADTEIGCYVESFGLKELRQALALRLKQTRGIRCTADQIVLCPGLQPTLESLVTLFELDERTVCMEDPGYYAARKVFESRNCTVVGIPTHNGPEAFAQALEGRHGNLLWLTPSNQFPLGYTLPLKERIKAIEWAKREGAYIIEDDYCCEFRYRSKPVPSLHSLDTSGHVIYIGTMSKILSPSLRISYAVLPENLVDRWYRRSAVSTSPIGWLEQKTLHQFMTKGKWNKHVHDTVSLFRSRNKLLCTCLEDAFGNKIDLLGTDAGQHLVLGMRDGRDANELIALAEEHGVRVYSLEHCWIDEDHPMRNYLLVGYSAIPDEQIPPAIGQLKKAWG